MVVAKVERALLRQRHMRRILFSENALQRHNLFVKIYTLFIRKLAQVFLRKIAEYREHRCRHCGSRAKIPVLNCCVYTRISRISQICFLLDLFLHGEQPSEGIGDVFTVFI